jgi:hypothetical protein
MARSLRVPHAQVDAAVEVCCAGEGEAITLGYRAQAAGREEKKEENGCERRYPATNHEASDRRQQYLR